MVIEVVVPLPREYEVRWSGKNLLVVDGFFPASKFCWAWAGRVRMISGTRSRGGDESDAVPVTALRSASISLPKGLFASSYGCMAKTTHPMPSEMVGEVRRSEPAVAAEQEAAQLDVPPGQVYVSAVQLAHRFGVGVKWINARKALLGATPISNSTNSKLRYYLPTADAYMQSRMSKPVEKRRRRVKRGASGEGLLEFV